MNANLKKGSVISLPRAEKLSREMRSRGKRLVTINGSFDLLHPGHLELLRKARSYGDALLVLLNSDASVKKYKGPSRPIVGERERALMLTGISGVDYVALFDDINPKRVLARIKPRIHCNASDWGKNCVERGVVEENGGTIKIIPLVEGYSTSSLLRSFGTNEEPVRAVFLDRDGTINDNGDGYIHKKEDFVLLPGALKALQTLSATDFKIIIITNQSGIGRGYYSEQDMHMLHDWFVKLLKKDRVRIDGIYYCPHHPDDACGCRKPGIQMFEDAARDFELSLAKSWFVGDSDSDVIAGREANIKSIKIGRRMPRHLKLEPHHYAEDLKEAVSIIQKSI